jgi:hypothetical protein
VPGPHPTQAIEHKFESGSATLRSPTGPLIAEVGPRWGRSSADPGGQQRTAGITSLEVSGGSQRLAWGAKLLDWAFTRQRPHLFGLSDAHVHDRWAGSRGAATLTARGLARHHVVNALSWCSDVRREVLWWPSCKGPSMACKGVRITEE